MLTERRLKGLEARVHEYVAFATPVGSRTLVDRYQLGFSPATVRSELANLEETGFLVSPHTSSGRVPTEAAYRIFVDMLLSQHGQFRPVHELETLAEDAGDADDLVKRTCAVLSHVTNCLSVVFIPAIDRAYLKRISLVSISPHLGIIVLVTVDGQVLDRQVAFGEEVSVERLSKVEGLFNELFAGADESQLVRFDHEEIMRAAHDPLAALLLDEVTSLLANDAVGEFHHQGVQALLSQPEFADSRHAIPVFMLLEDGDALMHLFEGIEDDDMLPTVRIGHEMGDGTPSGLSVVLKAYGDGSSRGIVSVIGPTRMDYAVAIPAIETVTHIFNEAL